MNDYKQEITDTVNAGDLKEAIKLCQKILADEKGSADAELWFIYGKLLWRMDMRPLAINAFQKAVELDDNSPAKLALEMSDDISSFFNPDLLNP